MLKWKITNWKKKIKRGDIIWTYTPNDIDKNEKQKYRPAIVLENHFNNIYPVQTLLVQTLTTLSNWSDQKKKESIQKCFFWNNKMQYVQPVNLKKVSYELIQNFYGRYKLQRFDDWEEPMQIIKNMYNINDDWTNLNMIKNIDVILTLKEQQLMTNYEKSLRLRVMLNEKESENTYEAVLDILINQRRYIEQLEQSNLEKDKESQQLKKQLEELKQSQIVVDELSENEEFYDTVENFDIDKIKQTPESEPFKLNPNAKSFTPKFSTFK